jgi:hypothetical protein
MSIDIGVASDYAVLEAGERTLYFGYEYATVEDADGDQESVFGFRYSHKTAGEVFGIAYDEMAKRRGCPPVFECAECLLFGLGIYLTEGPKAKEQP